MVVLYFADCDPGGWNMAISVSRKLQAIKAIEFGDMEFQVHRVGLTPDQVREYALPSTPLKDTERRADKWTAAMGVEQTEIDALIVLRADVLRQLAETRIAPFYDSHACDSRVRIATREWQWLRSGHRQTAAATNLSVRAERRGTAGREADRDRGDPGQVRVDAERSICRPARCAGRGRLDGDQPEPLRDQRWGFAEQCRRLIASKAYDSNGSG